MTHEDDPLTILHRSAVDVISRSRPMREAMGNAIKNLEAYDVTRQGKSIDVRAESDLPAIMFEPTGGPTNINVASNLIRFDYGFNFAIATGEQTVTDLLPIVWALMATIATLNPTGDWTALKWNDEPFVLSFQIDQAAIGLPDTTLSPGLKGWTSVCTVTFNLKFSKSKLATWVAGEVCDGA